MKQIRLTPSAETWKPECLVRHSLDYQDETPEIDPWWQPDMQIVEAKFYDAPMGLSGNGLSATRCLAD